jgi:hypothetical protein
MNPSAMVPSRRQFLDRSLAGVVLASGNGALPITTHAEQLRSMRFGEQEQLTVEEPWIALRNSLQESFDHWKAMSEGLNAEYRQALFEITAIPRLRLIPLVEAMRRLPALRPLYPYTSHYNLRMSTTRPGNSECKYSKIWAASAGKVRFQVLRVLPGGDFQTLGEGTATEMAALVAVEVAREDLWTV